MSYSEELTRKVFNFYLPRHKVLYNYRPDWLKNPETGHNLEIDIFYPNLKLAIEFQGFHHLTSGQIKKDAIKASILTKKKIDLVVIVKVYRITKQARRLYKRNPIKYKMFDKKIPRELKRKINVYCSNIIKKHKDISLSTKNYYLNTKFKIHLDEYKKRQTEEIERNIRLRKIKGLCNVQNAIQ